MIPESPGLLSWMREEDFSGVVVNDACKLLWVFISCSCHHLQNLSETNRHPFASMKMYYASNISLDSTHMMWHGSFLSFRQCPASHFFFVGNVVWIYLDPACVFLMQHHGASKPGHKHECIRNYLTSKDPTSLTWFLKFPPLRRFILYRTTKLIHSKMWYPHNCKPGLRRLSFILIKLI